MDEKQLLEAIRGIVQEETGKIVDNRLNSFRGEISGQIDSVRDEMKSGFDTLEQRMTRLEVSYENNTEKILNLLREDYSRVAAAAARTGDYDEVKSTVSDHDRALQNHNQRIAELEKQAI